jgi:hypothetical protein
MPAGSHREIGVHNIRNSCSRRVVLIGFVVALSAGCSAESVGNTDRDPSREGDDDGADDDSEVMSRDASSPSVGKADGGMQAMADGSEPAKVADGSTPASGGDSFFRVDSFTLKAPGVVLRPAGLEVRVTNQAQMGVDDALVSDTDPDKNGDGQADSGDGDGLVDLSLLIRFVGTTAPASKVGKTTFGGGSCPHPYTPERVCGANAELPFQTQTTSYTNGNNCALDGASHVAMGPCFTTQKSAITLTLPLLGDVPLEQGQVVGAWANEGKGGIVQGAIRGFLSESIARATKLGSDLPPLAVSLDIKPGTALAEFLPNAERSMNAEGTPGWWFLIQFSAKPALFDAAATLPTKK